MDDSQDSYHSFSSSNPQSQQSQHGTQSWSQNQAQPSQYTLDGTFEDLATELGSDDIYSLLNYDPVHDSLTNEYSTPASAMPATTRSAARAQQAPSTPVRLSTPSSTPSATLDNGGERARKRRRLNGQAPGDAPGGTSSRARDSRGEDIDLLNYDTPSPVSLSSSSGDELSPPEDLRGRVSIFDPPARTGFVSIDDIIDVSSPSRPELALHHSTTTHRTGSGPTFQRPRLSTRNIVDQNADSHQTQPQQDRSHQQQPTSQDGYMGGLEAIDLTSVTDAASLRQRAQVDEEERRARREASMRMEAKKAANQRMLQSTLAEQQRAEEKKPLKSGRRSKSYFFTMGDISMAEQKDGNAHKGIGSMQCVICMDNFTDLTATHCGHLFCHTCINEHLITAEMNVGNRSALCPFCRQPVFRKPSTRTREKDKTIVPLSFKVKSRASAMSAAAGTPTGTQDKGKVREIEQPD